MILIWLAAAFFAGGSVGLVLGGILADARARDAEAERVAEDWRWARMSPVERLEELRARALSQRDV